MHCAQFILIFVILLGLHDVIDADRLSWSRDDRQKVLDWHNALRAKVARGDVAGQPPAADMTALSWDDRLERHTIRWAKNCGGDMHDEGAQRRISAHEWVGQNFAGHSDRSILVNFGMNGWFDEHVNYDYSKNTCVRDICGHYTQMIWAKSHLVGCNTQYCAGHGMGRFVCNYAPGGNVGTEHPYKEGEACSKCPANDGYTFCMDGALCATKHQCANSRSGKCKCTVNKDICKRHGDFNSADCKCICRKGWKGINCEEPCVDNIDYCHQGTEYCTPGNKFYTWMRQVCQLTCDFCRQKTYSDSRAGHTDRLGLTVNSEVDDFHQLEMPQHEQEHDQEQVVEHTPGCIDEYDAAYCEDIGRYCEEPGFEVVKNKVCCATCHAEKKKRAA